MTHNRRGFFGRLAALFAAPVVGKLEPITDELDGYTDGGTEVVEFESELWPNDDTKTTHCPYIFKDVPCRYTGQANNCDKTFRTCRGLDNAQNFGGFPLMPNEPRRGGDFPMLSPKQAYEQARGAINQLRHD